MVKKGLNVLSLFDGMSCGRQALERAGIKVNNYYASEIDKYAMQVTMANYPDTKQLGSVTEVDGYSLPKIDLMIGGSPCQSFSFAGKRKGMSTKDNVEILTLEKYLELKVEGYEFEGQSYLFWEYMRLLKEVKPTYFLLENVLMGEKWQKILTQAIGINPIQINSALVSAQNRQRLYWTNIGAEQFGFFGDLMCMIPQPQDKGILLKDVLESEVDAKYFLSDKMIDGFLDRDIKHKNKGNGFTFNPTNGNKKGNAITNPGKNRTDDNYIVHNTMPRSSKTGKGGTGHLSRTDGKTYCLDTGSANAVEILNKRQTANFKSGDEKANSFLSTSWKGSQANGMTLIDAREVKQISTNNKSNGGTQPYQQDRIYDINGISPALSAGKSDLIISGTLRTHNDGKGFREVVSGKGATIPARAREDGSGQNIVSISGNIRRLTPMECERLQTVKDGYTNHVSDSQRYKMLGNGWTVSVIAHIFSHLK